MEESGEKEKLIPENEIVIKDFSTELVDHPHIIEYIKNLEEKLKSQKDVIATLENKIINYEKQEKNSKNELVTNETQTDGLEDEKTVENQNWIIDSKDKAGSILEQVTEAAESALSQTDFIYEQTSGLYYHYNSGYYYDPQSKLYYNGNTGTYYYYDEESKSYKFHSQIQREIDKTSHESSDKKKVKCKRKNKDKIKKQKLIKEKEKNAESEEIQCDEKNNEIQRSPNSSIDTLSTSTSNSSETENDEDDAKVHPPCMRIIVKETKLSNLKIGSLFIVTYPGGSIGREGDHSVIIPDINISKHHAKLQYNEDKKLYEIIDLGSRNGTLLNGKRLSVAKKESEPNEIMHGSMLQLNHTKLLCHIHNGYDTCGHCEPGLLQSDPIIYQNTISIKSQYQLELNRIKLKFGLDQEDNETTNSSSSGYQDRARLRRKNIGSSNDHHKTQQSSLNEIIPKDNMGFKMLVKMGWSEGKSLGKCGNGITEPVPLVQAVDDGELDPTVQIHKKNIDLSVKKKQIIWKKAQQRFSDSTEKSQN